MANNLELGIGVLSRNSSDIADIVQRLGGVTGVLAAAPSVLRLFKTINELNAENPEEAVPLQYGTQTQAEVRAFQRKHFTDPDDIDGIIGDKTWRKIKQLLITADRVPTRT